ncbi:helix-turn-helix domain-containing protein [Sorangium sp. So ce394]|uniref:helix-turn-helix domain-containing protein n=1 Tax=Sorangium sp. So ce394 TaxID=3133310 RepID=UPI003F5C9353
MSEDRKRLGVKLRDAREYLGLSQDEVAKSIGVTRSAVSLIESGQRRVDAFELKRLADLYQRPVAEFTGDTDVIDAPVPETVQHLARAAAKLTEADRAELLRFAEFLSVKAPVKREG